MARIRTAKPSWWSDPLLVLVSRDVRFTYRGLIECCADDEGRFKADPRIIKGKVWPLDDDLTPAWIADALAILEDLGRSDVDGELGRIVRWTHRNVAYGWIPRFNKHQYIAHPTESQLPDVPDAILAIAETRHRRRPIAGTKLAVIDVASDLPRNPPKIEDAIGGSVHVDFPRTAQAIASKRVVRELLAACTDNLTSALRKQAFARSILEAAEGALARGCDPNAIAVAAVDYTGALASGKETPHIGRWRGYIDTADKHITKPRRGRGTKADGERTSGKYRYKASTREARL